jgi:hypothetical protein
MRLAEAARPEAARPAAAPRGPPQDRPFKSLFNKYKQLKRTNQLNIASFVVCSSSAIVPLTFL